MDAFESVVATIVEREGFWVRTSFKVKLTGVDKHAIGRKTCPRWEIDVLGYRPGDNLLWIVECKSYLDSRGSTATDSLQVVKSSNYSMIRRCVRSSFGGCTNNC